VYELASIYIKIYHSDNGVYDSTAIDEDCAAQNQKKSFSGVGAKHEKSFSECCIQTVSYWVLHDDGACHSSLVQQWH
jgi:hypothetical protein